MSPHPAATSAQGSSSFAITAVVPPGLEEPAAAELVALGASEVRPLRRAVACRTDLAGFYRLHLQARLPFRFLRELARFPCRTRRELRRGVQAAADWDRWLPPERSFKVEASGSLPELNHSHYTALEVKNALVDRQRQRWGERSTVDLANPDLCLHLHLSPRDGGIAILSLEGGGGGVPSDGLAPAGENQGRAMGGAGFREPGSRSGRAGGSSLHRRGYRAAMGLAPLKENLAAGLIAHTGWDGSVPLLDPLCGSGTLLLEAAAMALGRAPGLQADPEANDTGGGVAWGLAGAQRGAQSGDAGGWDAENAQDGGRSGGASGSAGGAADGRGRAWLAAPPDASASSGRTQAVSRDGNGPDGTSPDPPAAAPRPRAFGFRRWPDFDAALWSREVAAAALLRRDSLADGRPLAPILGLEHDPQVLEQARANAAAAGLADSVALQQGDFRSLEPPPGPGVLVCNPPYGVRLGRGDDLEGLYADLGRMVRERCSGWTLWLLSGNPELTGALRLKASRRIAVSNGGLDCRWLRYEIR